MACVPPLTRKNEVRSIMAEQILPLTTDRTGITVILNDFQRECKRCSVVPETILLVARPEDTEANRTAVFCPRCDNWMAWANKAESGKDTKSCRSSEFPTGVRMSVLKRDNFTCQSCGRKAPDVILHIDHIIPAAQDGLSVEPNGITLCQECNLGKGKEHSAIVAFRLWLKTVTRQVKEDVSGGTGGT